MSLYTSTNILPANEYVKLRNDYLMSQDTEKEKILRERIVRDLKSTAMTALDNLTFGVDKTNDDVEKYSIVQELVNKGYNVNCRKITNDVLADWLVTIKITSH